MATTSLTNNLTDNEFGFNLLDYIKTKPELMTCDFDDIGYIHWNDASLILTKDYRFFDFDDLCMSMKNRKIKTCNSPSGCSSYFNTHFGKPNGLKAKHPDRFKELYGHRFVHVMYLEVACKGIFGDWGVEWFNGEEDWDFGCGEGYIYLIYIIGMDAFKFGKADNFDVRLTNYLSEIKDRSIREQGIKVLALFKVKNMSDSEDRIGFYWDCQEWKHKTNSNEYYTIPLNEFDSLGDRLTYVQDTTYDALKSINKELNDKEWSSIAYKAESWTGARLKLPSK